MYTKETKLGQKTSPEDLKQAERELPKMETPACPAGRGTEVDTDSFERNLDLWRQLWRVIERSDIVVQIVDARNPLLFRCEDLECYVKEVDAAKENVILISKADLLTAEQRFAWAEHFEKKV